MKFGDALILVRAGKKVTRPIWDAFGWTMELVQYPPLPDGRETDPMLMIWDAQEKVLRSFTGGDWDVLAEDWKIAE